MSCKHCSYKTIQETYKNYLMSVSELDSSKSDGSSSENNDEFELKEVKKGNNILPTYTKTMKTKIALNQQCF